jgi:hypothetical protein
MDLSLALGKGRRLPANRRLSGERSDAACHEARSAEALPGERSEPAAGEAAQLTRAAERLA